MKRLLVLTQRPEEACTRYRGTQYAPYLESSHTKLDVIPSPGKRREQATLLRSLSDWDSVVLQRRLPSLRQLREIRRTARRLVYDCDAAIIFSDSARSEPRLRLRNWIRFRALAGCCDAITAGNAYLASLASRYADPSRVFVVPTAVEPALFQTPSPEPSPYRVLGWIGSAATLPYLLRLGGCLKALTARRKEIVLRVISDAKPDVEVERLEWVPWQESSEATQLSRLQVGLAPLPDDRRTRGKCSLRLLQYMAAGIPAVASAVGTQEVIIQAGGALGARSEGDWAPAIERLLDDAHWRMPMLSAAVQ